MIPTQTIESLWHRYRQNRDTRTRNRLVELNLGLAREQAHRFKDNCPEPYEDLVQIGTQGLIRAVERFDVNRDAAFSSFAMPYIRGAIMHHLRDHWGHLKIPRRAYEDAGRVKNTCIKLESMGRKCDRATVAVAMGMSEAKWQWVEQATQRKQLACIDDLHHLSDEDEDEQPDYSRLKIAIARLPRLKRMCIQDYWFKGLSEAAIARRHKLTLAIVQSLLSEAFDQLKHQLSDEVSHA